MNDFTGFWRMACCFGWWCCCSSVQAAGLTTADTSVTAMGAGGTAVVRPHDAASAYSNPAALMMLPGWHVAAGAVLVKPQLRAISANWQSNSQTPGSWPPHLYASYIGKAWGVGLSFSAPMGSRVDWPEKWPLRFDSVSGQIMVLRSTAFVAARWRAIAVAAGAVFDFATFRSQSSLDFIEAEGQVALHTQALGLGGYAGIYWQSSKRWALGLSYHSRIALNFKGQADFQTPPEFFSRARDGAVSLAVQLPDRIALGGRFEILPNLGLSAEVQCYDWRSVQRFVIDFESEHMDDAIKERRWSTTWVPRLGAHWRAISWLQLRAGAFFDPTPVPAETVGAASPDSTRLGVSLGATLYLPSGMAVVMGYQWLQFLGQTRYFEQQDAVRFVGTAHLAGISVQWSTAHRS